LAFVAAEEAMPVIIDQSAQIAAGEIVDNLYVGQTFVAAGTNLESLSFFLDGQNADALHYRVLVTTVVATSNGFHPGKVLFESGKLSEPLAPASHKVTVDTGGIALLKGQTYAFIIDPVTDQDGLPSKARFAHSFSDHGGIFGEDYDDGFQVRLTSTEPSREEDFATDWQEFDGTTTGLDLAFVLVFSNPGVTIVGTRSKDIVDAEHRIKGQPKPTGDDDTILGKNGKDRLNGLAGDDTIDGGKKKDKLTGGPDDDTFVFSVSLSQKPDKVMDFVSTDDTILLKGKAFRKLDPGVLSDAAFRDIGEAASENDRIVYRANGTLALDEDGKGGAKADVFTKLAGAPDIAAADIVVA
jgi:Ca2+-binding RTX toxin-like protein